MKASSIGLAVALGLAAACSSSSQPQAADPEPSPRAPDPDPLPPAPPGPPPGQATECERLPRTHCLRVQHCTLVHVATGQYGQHQYACRIAEGECEVGLSQARLPDEPSLCTSRAGCRYEPGQCYCRCRGSGQTAVPDGIEAEDCVCECAGGPPPRCIAR